MLEQLKELLEMQKALDETLMKEHGLTEYPLGKTKIALFTELGEMMNELQTEFKWWKKHAKYDREKALEEYVDCLHFCLSLFNYHQLQIGRWVDYNIEKPYKIGDEHFSLNGALRWCAFGEESSLQWLFDIGKYFGFTWKEIYTTYKKKNEVNYQRLKDNY